MWSHLYNLYHWSISHNTVQTWTRQNTHSVHAAGNTILIEGTLRNPKEPYLMTNNWGFVEKPQSPTKVILRAALATPAAKNEWSETDVAVKILIQIYSWLLHTVAIKVGIFSSMIALNFRSFHSILIVKPLVKTFFNCEIFWYSLESQLFQALGHTL